MSKFNSILGRVCFIVPAVLSLGVLSACRGGSPEARAERVTERIASHLDLNSEQKAKLDAIKAQFLANRAELRKDRLATADQLIVWIKSDRLDQAKVKAAFSQKLDQVEQKAPRMIELFAEFHASLNAQQKEKLASKITRFKERLSDH